MEKILKDCRAFARLEDKVMEKELKGYVCSVEDREGNKKNCRAFAGSAKEARRRLMQKFHDCYVGFFRCLTERITLKIPKFFHLLDITFCKNTKVFSFA